MVNINFKEIAPHRGGQREAFEDLCCQLAHSSVSDATSFVRLAGAGGDGGLECYVDLPDDSRMGWQAKYVFDVNSLITQATESLTTAFRIHPSLKHYIICFPFDLSGPTARRGKSGVEKLEAWRQEQVSLLLKSGREAIVEIWPASRLQSLLLEHDSSGGIRLYFFNRTILGREWFSEHLEQAKATAGPRYTPALNVETDFWKWISAFGRDTDWTKAASALITNCRKQYRELDSATRNTSSDSAVPDWLEQSKNLACRLVAKMKEIFVNFEEVLASSDIKKLNQYTGSIEAILGEFESLESDLVAELDAKHGPGKVDTPGFRQFMAEYMCSFPAANLDRVRDANSAIHELLNWLRSPCGFLGFPPAFILSGAAGSGKTHGVCDAAFHRYSQGLLSCVLFGHQFCGEPDPWTRLTETLGLPSTLGTEGILSALNAAGEATGSSLIIFIDGVNETRPLSYWRKRLDAFVHAASKKPFLRICITCRTPFLSCSIPETTSLPVVEHLGFSGIERDACNSFFRFYDLTPPVTPILQPELSNPLYLRLVCETLVARGIKNLPSGWLGLSPVINGFLEEKERQFADEHDVSIGAKAVTSSLRIMARAIVASRRSSISWSSAQKMLSLLPAVSNLSILQWLIRSDLVIEDAPTAVGPFGEESELRLSFERLGDFLIASEMMAKATKSSSVEQAFTPEGICAPFLKSVESAIENAGVLSAVSILLPEAQSGQELPNLVDNEDVRLEVLKTTIEAFAWRDPATFSPASGYLLRQALGIRDFSSKAMEAVLSVAWQPSAIDARWLNRLLTDRPMPLRDAYWCWFLNDNYEAGGAVRRLIDAAFDLQLDQLEPEVAELWSMILLWFTAAADRRVKDRATRAAVGVLTAHAEMIPPIISNFIECDDDEVRERTLTTSYGALLLSRNSAVAGTVAKSLSTAYKNSPACFSNALIRDDIRCIIELAKELGAVPSTFNAKFAMKKVKSPWQLEVPSQEDVKRWESLPKLVHSCTDDDFYIYSMNCLRPWMHHFKKPELGKWVLNRVARDFGYEGSGCENYDRYMLAKFGGGRSRKGWAERIGKKYQWLALFQLASHLHDHTKRKDEYGPKPVRTPLILLEERKIDPTLPGKVERHDEDSKSWWFGGSVDFGLSAHLNDSDWITYRDDVPLLDKFLSAQKQGNQSWRLLASYPDWSDRDDLESDNSYRHVWIHIQSYLVQKEELHDAFDCLHRRNFFGDWMPGHSSWLYGFAGEYPFGTPFNTEPDTWHGHGNESPFLPKYFSPSWNEVTAEWQYDGSIPRNWYIKVPSKRLFESKDLSWNGRDGFWQLGGKTIFRDPHMTEGGTSALIADIDDLNDRLNQLGLCLIWTLLGEKWIIGGRSDRARWPISTFSQVAGQHIYRWVHSLRRSCFL